MKIVSLLIFIGILSFDSLNAQDIDIFSKEKNDNYQMPQFNTKMSFEEFQILNWNLRMQDMLYAMIVPGYVHFKVKDKTLGYSLLGMRLTGFAAMYYVAHSTNITLPLMYDMLKKPELIENNLLEEERNILYFSGTLILATYLFDWIHGKHRLDKKQEMIRYRYGMKLNLASISLNHSSRKYVGISLQYRF